MTKSHVGIGVDICPICGNKHNKVLLLDKRMKKTLEPETALQYSLCEKCKGLADQGYIALIGCVVPDNMNATHVKPDQLDRTGSIAHVRTSVWDQIFDMPLPDKPLAFVDQRVIDQLQHQMVDTQQSPTLH